MDRFGARIQPQAAADSRIVVRALGGIELREVVAADHIFHIPSDFVVDRWASSVESRSTLNFLYVPDVELHDLS
jgi:hypothetical protein